MLIWCSAFDAGYEPRARAFVESLNFHKPLDRRIVIGVNYEPQALVNVEAIMTDYSKIEQYPSKIRCLQHGSFIQALNDVKDDDIIVFSDADAVIQRAETSDERDFLESLQDNEIAVWWNAFPNQTLQHETQFLMPNVSLEELDGYFPGYANCACFNTGCIAGTVKAFKTFVKEFGKYYNMSTACFEHYARQQWAMSYVLQNTPLLQPRLLPETFHAHGCHGLPSGVESVDGVWEINRKSLLFAHNFDWLFHQ